jgi:hypothetical protein
MDQQELSRVCIEFVQVLNSINGVYLDAVSGFHQMRELITKGQLKALEHLKATQPELATIEYIDSIGFTYGKGDPNLPGNRIQHACTQGEFKARNAEGGENYIFLANVCLVTIYQFWEDLYRQKIATALGVSKNELRSPIMGDLRLLRNSIIHNGGIATSDAERCEVIQWFKRSDRIAIDKNQFEMALHQIAAYISSLVDSHGSS